MKWKKLINLEQGFHINLRQTTYSKELAHVIFCCQNSIDTGFFNRLLLGMKSGFYMSTTHANANRSNPEDLPEPELKNDLHPKKVMLSIWWHSKCIIYYELLRPNTTIDSKLYCEQLQNLKVALQANCSERRKVRLLHDNAKPHTSKITRQKLEEFRVGGSTSSTLFTISGTF